MNFSVILAELLKKEEIVLKDEFKEKSEQIIDVIIKEKKQGTFN